MMKLTPFLDVLRASFALPGEEDARPPSASSVREAKPTGSKKRPPPAASASSSSSPLPPAAPWIRAVESTFAFQQPLADSAMASSWSTQLSDQQRRLLRVLCVDHKDLVEARERDVTRRAVGAVVTAAKQQAKKKTAKAPPPLTITQELLRHCQEYIAAAASGDAPSVFVRDELADTILQTVHDAQGQPDALQAHLFGLVGVDGLSLISFVMEHAQSALARGGSVTSKSLQDAQQQEQLAAMALSSASVRPPTSFSIQTATERQQLKQQRKAHRRATRGRDDGDDMGASSSELQGLAAAGYDLEVLRLQRQFDAEDQANAVSTSHLLREFGALEGGYDTTGAAGQLASAGKITLPSNTQRMAMKGYDRVHIPARAKKALAKGEALVPISQLDTFAQTAFVGTKTLNRLQSKLFDAAYKSNQNLLVCAPTGAGKTNVAMLAILQEVKSQFQRHGDSALGTTAHGKKQMSKTANAAALGLMKIIYVAPMKALAQEVVTKFGERLRALHLKVAELTGDMQMTKKEIEETHLIVTTPEKWDVITRKSSTQQALLSRVRLLIIDEVHLLADERGPVIETIVARTLRRVESTQSMIRIVGLSATLPNYADVATFLRVYVPPGGSADEQNAATNGGRGGLFYFDGTYRPVPLDQSFIGVTTTPHKLREALQLSVTDLATTLDSDELTKKKGAGAGTEGGAAPAPAPGAPGGPGKLRQQQMLMNKLALVHCAAQVRAKEQVMVFVHSRKETAATMRAIVELAQEEEAGEDGSLLEAFLPPDPEQSVSSLPTALRERLQRSRNRELKELVAYGLGIHHAGMLRSDRNLTEDLFARGVIRVLCCTATLAWGVNLPAHSVLIKGTQVYNADKGGMTQLSMLDVMQIFGRAGRPQYDTSGDAVLMTTQDQLPHYLRLLTTGIPMESALIKALPDHLNAEIVSGTVSNLDEACEWLSYTYLFVRMKKNPLAYGISYEDVQLDPLLKSKRKALLMDAAETLQGCRMIKIMREKKATPSLRRMLEDGEAGTADEDGKIVFAVTAMGRVASHFYIQHQSIQTFNELLDAASKPSRDPREQVLETDDEDEADDSIEWERALLILCSSTEFTQLKAREDEINELEKLRRQFCRFDVLGGGVETYMGKTNVLLQALIGRARISSFTLISDTNYVAQNASRVCRALFEICLKKNSARRADAFLQIAKSIDQKIWWDQSALMQLPNVPSDVVSLVAQRHLSLYDLLVVHTQPELVSDSQSALLRNGDPLTAKERKWVNLLPFVDVSDVQLQPLGAGSMVRVSYTLLPLFPEWRENAFGGRSLSFWLWVEDADSGFIYHSEYVVLNQSSFMGWKEGTQRLDMECFVPVFVSPPERPTAHYVIRVLSDRFVGIESWYEMNYTPPIVSKIATDNGEDGVYTKLLSLHPLPLRSLKNPAYEALYTSKFQFLNPIQTQTFHQLYHQDGNVLICAPTGSGKTMCAELAMMRIWNTVEAASPKDRKEVPSLIVYIAPLKALAREKVTEWKERFERHPTLRKKVVEVTGDTLVNVAYLLTQADIVVTTPEKWDLLTRSVTTAGAGGGAVGKQLMARTALVILDEVHLVGEAPRGAVLEVLVSRLRRFSAPDATERIVALGEEASVASGSDVEHNDTEVGVSGSDVAIVQPSAGIRLLGLSTALANATDVGAWLGIKPKSNNKTPSQDANGQVYNFRASVRPVPMQVHVQGFPERHYVARMAAMNKPTFMAIRTHSPTKPALVFVSSKAQTKLTALDLISCCVSHADDVNGGSNSAKPFLTVDESVMDAICRGGAGNGRGHGRQGRRNVVIDETLRHTLSFGIGLHHAGLARSDRELVEKLFRDRMIQVVISTSTLAWGVNLPAHLVVIKGTEYFADGRYRSYPLSDLLQMIGRAGRPLLDDSGVACVLVEETKKNMIQRLLYEPLAVESSLTGHLENHLNAEIASGLISTKADIVQYLSWSLLFQRVLKNPSYYGYDDGSINKGVGAKTSTGVESFFQRLIDSTLDSLVQSQCVTLTNKPSGNSGKRGGASSKSIAPTFSGKLAAALYVDVRSVSKMLSALTDIATEKSNENADRWIARMLSVICESCVEISATTPLRHNEVQSGLAATLCGQVRYSPMTHLYARAPKSQRTMLETHGSEVKAFLVLQMHLLGIRMPSSDFHNDLRLLLDQMPRLLSVAIDIAAHLQHHELMVAGIRLSQALVQGVWPSPRSAIEGATSELTQLPFLTERVGLHLRDSSFKVFTMPELRDVLSDDRKKKTLLKELEKMGSVKSGGVWSEFNVREIIRVLEGVPRFSLTASTLEGGNSIRVEMVAADGQNTTQLASTRRGQKPKPYGFYVLLIPSDASEGQIQIKHVPWRAKVTVLFDNINAATSHRVEVYSDAISGIDQFVDIAKQ